MVDAGAQGFVDLLEGIAEFIASGAVDAVESMLVLSPETAGLWREAGVLYMRSGQLKRSVEACE